MSGGKGGSNTSSVQIPAWLEGPASRNLTTAEEAAKVGYMPYYGPDVAAQTQNQLLGNQATYDAAAAFGLAPQGGNANAGMPEANTFAGGVQGYSSGGLYDMALAELAGRNPGQVAQYQRQFVDPQTGNMITTGEQSAAALQSVLDPISQYNATSTSNAGENIGVQLTPEQRYYGMMGFNDAVQNYPVYMPGGLLSKGLTALNNMQMTNYENANLGWGTPYGDTTGVQVIDSRDSDSNSSGPSYSVSDLGLGGSFDPSGTGGGNYSGTGGGGGLVF